MNLLFQKGKIPGCGARSVPRCSFMKSPPGGRALGKKHKTKRSGDDETRKDPLFRRAGAARALLLENLPQRAVSVEMTKERRDSAPLFSLSDSF